MAKERLDVLVTDLGLFDTREKAKRAIMAGLVLVNGRIEDKAGTRVDTEATLEIKGQACPYVSRGGFKLEKMIRETGLDLSGFHCADVGASTGGFTDCMLQNGALRVYSVDVGYGQLDWKLRNDPRVVNMERTNFRELAEDAIPELLDLVSIDVSFISLRLILPNAVKILKPGGHLLALIKPQFEAGREAVGKNGVVRDPAVHESVIRYVLKQATELGIHIEYLSFSPIKGPKGNIEFLMKGVRAESLQGEAMVWDVAGLVAEAHRSLNRSVDE